MTKIFKVPWAAWRDPEYLELEFPDSWNVSLYRMKAADNSEFSSEEIKEIALRQKGVVNTQFGSVAADSGGAHRL